MNSTRKEQMILILHQAADNHAQSVRIMENISPKKNSFLLLIYSRTNTR